VVGLSASRSDLRRPWVQSPEPAAPTPRAGRPARRRHLVSYGEGPGGACIPHRILQSPSAHNTSRSVLILIPQPFPRWREAAIDRQSTTFTKLESSEADTARPSQFLQDRPIFPRGHQGFEHPFASSVRTWSSMGVAYRPRGRLSVHPAIPALQFVEPSRAMKRQRRLLAESRRNQETFHRSKRPGHESIRHR